jgi:hypothetical protein
MKFQMLNEPVMSDFIIDPSQINPVLKASDNRIKALEEEVVQKVILIPRWISARRTSPSFQE